MPSFAEEVLEVVERIKPILAGKAPPVQSAVLAELLWLYLAGFCVDGDAGETLELRAELLAKHCMLVRQLTTVNAQMLGTQILKQKHERG